MKDNSGDQKEMDMAFNMTNRKNQLSMKGTLEMISTMDGEELLCILGSIEMVFTMVMAYKQQAKPIMRVSFIKDYLMDKEFLSKEKKWNLFIQLRILLIF
jgi:hypothetical protein